MKQGELPDFIFFVVSGHCDCVKQVFLPGFGRRLLLCIGHLEVGQFFGEDRVVDDAVCYSSVVSKAETVCFKIPRLF